jgi:hypothetical protein
VDENGNNITTASVSLANGSGTYTAPSTKLGYYRVNATLADGSGPAMLGTRPEGFITYAVVPDPATRLDYGDSLSRFGMQGGFASSQGAVIPYLGIRYVLGGMQSWSALEPNSSGQFAAALAGNQVPATVPYLDAVTYNGKPWRTYEIAQLASASMPSWAGPLAGTAGTLCTSFGALNPAGVTGLPAFATALATAFPRNYPGQSQHFYQVTWEPETPWCFNGSGAQLTQYYQLVYAALHAADPTAQVMGPTLFYGDASQLEGLYAAGFGSSIDAFSIHPYAAWPFETTSLVADLRAQMAQATAAAGKTIPFFGTEHGLVSGQVGELNQALGNVREEIMLIGEGFIHDYSFYIADFWGSSPTETGNTYGFYWNLDPKVPYGTDKLGPKPAVPAYAAMTYLLDGSSTKGPVSSLSGTQMGYRFLRNGTTTLALWDYGAASSTVKLPVASGSTVQLCDWMGNCSSTTGSNGSLTLTLGAAPIYVIGQGI